MRRHHVIVGLHLICWYFTNLLGSLAITVVTTPWRRLKKKITHRENQ